MNRKPITTVIVDDEMSCIQQLSKDLAFFPEISIVETTTSSLKARDMLIQQQPDLLFLDVEMPQMNGFELLQSIRLDIHQELRVVFYTAFNEYMIDALRHSAFDFLQKPYLPEELALIIRRVREEQKESQLNFEQSIRSLLSADRKFAIQTITGLLMLKNSEIVCFNFISELHCWKIMLTDRSEYKLQGSTTAKDLLAISSSFVQTSQSNILNIDYLFSIENNSLRCILHPQFQDMEIIASRRYFKKIKDQLEII